MRATETKRVLAACSVWLLASCGGGEADSPSSATAPAPPPPVLTTTIGATFLQHQAGIPAYSPVGDIDIDSFAYLNRQRRELGMPEVIRNSVVSAVAAAHSSYQVVNKMAGHYEDAGKTGFTGVTPADRVGAKYTTNYVGEVLVYWTGEYRQTTAPAKLLFDAPFHRLGILTGGTKAGSGHVSDAGSPATHAWTWDIVDYQETMDARQVLVYPYPAQTNAPYSWVNNETPNPLASRADLSGATVGYPITLQIRGADTLNVTSFAITDSRDASVPCEKLDHNNSTETLSNFAICTPYAALKGNETYTVATTGTINSGSFTLSWQFSTVASQAAINSYDSRNTASPPASVLEPDGPYARHID